MKKKDFLWIFRACLPWNSELLKVRILVFFFLLGGMSQAFASNTANDDGTQTLKSFQSTEEFGASDQQRTLTGKVTDENGEPLPGVTVVVKGTTTGTTTNIDGIFTLSNLQNESILQFSFVGMISQEIEVGSQSSIDIVMEPDAIGLEEVVAIGYTTRKKGEITGAVSTINSETIERSSNKDIAKSLSGKISGVIVSDRGGYPGSTGDITLLIRGKSTLNNNSPLILIDGITAASFSHLSPQDIKSIAVLKDGAAAIYGARAANGVILITTKRGKSGKPQINISSTYNISKLSSQPKLMSSEQYAIYSNERAERYNLQADFTPEDIKNYAAGNDPINYPNTDWMDLTMANSSPELRTSASVSGGNDNMKYFVSADMIDQKGLYESGDLKFKQRQVRSNLDINITKRFAIGVDLSGSFGERNEPGIGDSFIYSSMYGNEPTQVGVYPNGLPGWGGENGRNPYVMSSNESGFVKRIDNKLRGRFSFDWDLGGITEGLRLKGFAGLRKENNDTKDWYTPWTIYQYFDGEYVPGGGYAQADGQERILRESFWKYDETLLNATLYYSTILGDGHNISAFAGYEQSTSESRNFWAERRGFPTPDHSELFAGSDDGQQSYGTSQEWARVNYYGSFSYDFNKKYFLDFTLRHDGSSNFGPGNRFGTFPGVAASWAINQESFMEDISWLNTLKIRASWAKMGNDRIAPFQYLTRYAYGGPTNTAQPNYFVFGTSGGTSYNGYTPDNVPNPDVTWETAFMKNIGLNFTLFDNRLSGNVNYFHQKREDILVTRAAAIPDAAGLTLPQENIGKVNNFGWEFEFAWNDKIGEVQYNIGANFTQAKNEVVYLAEALDVPDALKREGYPMDSYVLYLTNGVFADQAAVDAAPAKKEGTVEGEPYYIDSNNDGEINAGDRVRSYTSNVPEIQYGIFGGINYKSFNFNFLFMGQAKVKTLVYFDTKGPEFLFTERWTPENRNARYPRAFISGDTYSGFQSANIGNFEGADIWYRDASYIRLKEVELGYTFNRDKIKIGDLKIFVRGMNLLTMFSDIYDLGLDPEASGYNTFRDSRYPSLKTYSFGVNLIFN